MPKNFLKFFLILGTFSFSFLFFGDCSAKINLISPVNGAENVCIGGEPKEGGCEVEPYFRWNESSISGVVQYNLSIKGITQSEDNITPEGFCTFEGVCSFSFLELTIGNIEYADEYFWRIVAYNEEGEPVDYSDEYKFKTEDEPYTNCPYVCLTEEGCGEIKGVCINGEYECPEDEPCCCKTQSGASGLPLRNPLNAETLEEAIEAFIDIFFFLIMLLAPVLILYSAFLLLTAHGDPAKISKAKTVITWTVVAIAIALFAKGIPDIESERRL